MKNPYNTYKNMIPPSPINSPGLNAIKAAIYPAKTDYLFMFSPSNSNYHIFTKTNEEHSKAIKSSRKAQ